MAKFYFANSMDFAEAVSALEDLPFSESGLHIFVNSMYEDEALNRLDVAEVEYSTRPLAYVFTFMNYEEYDRITGYLNDNYAEYELGDDVYQILVSTDVVDDLEGFADGEEIEYERCVA